jgi:predicted KAP-like P-loop ATPase
MSRGKGKTVKLVSDNPATLDTLGLGATADLLSQVVLSAAPPFVLGLFGEWGSGKTTLMRLVDERVRASGAKSVWFNAWKYDGKEVIWNALIQSIFYAIRDDPDIKDRNEKASFRQKVGDAAVSLAQYAAKVGTRFIPGGIIKEDDIDKVASFFTASDATTGDYGFINKFEKRFDELVTEYVGDGATLTVFIDDLDRCLPENAISVLEALKLFLKHSSYLLTVQAAYLL